MIYLSVSGDYSTERQNVSRYKFTYRYLSPLSAASQHGGIYASRNSFHRKRLPIFSLFNIDLIASHLQSGRIAAIYSIQNDKINYISIL